MKTKKIVAFIIVATLMLCNVATAFAKDLTSPAKSSTVYGHKYEYWSTVGSNDSRFILYSLTTKVIDNAPTGYFGQKARLYSEDTSLVSYRDWSYNTEDVTTTTTCVFPEFYDNPSAGQYFYSKGQARFYNGNGYTTYNSNATPTFQTPKSASFVQKNARGEIYGSELFLEEMGIEADLIQALGNNGHIGYVRSSDLNYGDYVTTPEEAMEYMAQNRPNRIIPVYESDGITIIDTFTITSGQNTNITYIK